MEVRPTVTVENVDTLTNDTGVIVEPASVNIRKNPTTNQYVDEDITAKSITIPGKAFTGVEERWIEIRQGATIRKAKYKIDGVAVHEQPWNRKTILTVTDDFSTYEKGTPATINVYLTATATLKVIDMPFNLVFFKTDHLGTPRVITDQDGKVLSRHDYLAYGEEITTADFQTNRMKFTGHERDPETGLDYMLARYYTSGSGRMLQVDPVDDYDFNDPMSFNKYSYVRCNPIMGTDPTGMNSVKDMLREAERKKDEREKRRESQARKARAHYNYVSGFTQSAMPALSGAGLTQQEKKNVQNMTNIKSGATTDNKTNGGTQENCSVKKSKGWTIAVGYGFTAGFVDATSGSSMFTLDSTWNLRVVESFGGGAMGGASASANLIFQITDATSSDQLAGRCLQTGGSIPATAFGLPLSFGGEYIERNSYSGFNFNPGLGVGTPEAHVMVEETIVIPFSVWYATTPHLLLP